MTNNAQNYPRARVWPFDRAKEEVWCGGSGWMTVQDLLREVEEGIRAYAVAQPLRFRTIFGRRLQNMAANRFYADQEHDRLNDSTTHRTTKPEPPEQHANPHMAHGVELK